MSQAIQLSLDDWGRILIPDALRQRLGLKPGMMLVVEDAE
jgi:AbrB family looped-hinge helix DNA binding protein